VLRGMTMAPSRPDKRCREWYSLASGPVNGVGRGGGGGLLCRGRSCCGVQRKGAWGSADGRRRRTPRERERAFVIVPLPM